MTRLFTADLHIGHDNVIGYCNRPFNSVAEMNAVLVAEWNMTVGPDDEVWVVGDLAMGRLGDSLAVASHLVGRKHLVLGNHDKPFRGRAHDEYRAAGFELHEGVITLELADGVNVLVCHFPYVGDSGDHDRYPHHRPSDEGAWLIHGHVHDRWRQRGRMINVGVDAWGGAPVTAERLAQLVSDGPNDLMPLPWSCR